MESKRQLTAGQQDKILKELEAEDKIYTNGLGTLWRNDGKVLCQSCLQPLETKFELDRQLCHLCNVTSEAQWERTVQAQPKEVRDKIYANRKLMEEKTK